MSGHLWFSSPWLQLRPPQSVVLLQTGQPSAGSQTVATPEVTIDGLPATVAYSGLTAGLVGFNQINIVVPGLARTNAADPMTLKINNVAANNVTLPVGP